MMSRHKVHLLLLLRHQDRLVGLTDNKEAVEVSVGPGTVRVTVWSLTHTQCCQVTTRLGEISPALLPSRRTG